MRKFFSLLLVLLITFQSFGLLLFYWGEIHQCKLAFKEYLDSQCYSSEQLVAFSANDKTVELIGDDEISVKGKLFDIVKKENQEGEIIYYAMRDEKEDHCVEGLSQLAKNNSPVSSLPGKTTALQLLKCTIEIKYFVAPFDLDLQQFSKRTLTIALIFFPSPFRKIFSPPPNLLLS